MEHNDKPDLLTPRVSRDLGDNDTWDVTRTQSSDIDHHMIDANRLKSQRTNSSSLLKRRSVATPKISRLNFFSKSNDSKSKNTSPRDDDIRSPSPVSPTTPTTPTSQSSSPIQDSLSKSDSRIPNARRYTTPPQLVNFQRALSDESNCHMNISSTPRTSRVKQQSSHPGINEVIIKHKIAQWKEAKAGSPRNKIIVNYELGKQIGKGGSGSKIYQCRLDDGGMFAVKCFEISNMIEADIQNIIHEREIMEQLPYHKNLTGYRGHSDTEDKMYIFMNLYGDNLLKYLRELNDKNKYLSLQNIIKLSIDILTGISILHECDIMHRDIKSSNIFVNYGPDNDINYLTIGDFDTAKKIMTIDGTKTCIGTPLWIAPEVINFGKEGKGTYTFSADIWSFGMVLYEMMTCQLPFNNIKGPFGHLHKIIEGILPELTPEQTERYNIILPLWKQCLDLNPDNRPSADKLLSEFETLFIKN